MTSLRKICGITRIEDAEMVASYFPDFMGFVFHKPSSHHISRKNFFEISDALRVCFEESCPKFVAVVVNPTEKFLEEISEYTDVFQFHGEETPEFCERIQKKFPHHKIWKAIKMKEESSLQNIAKYSSLDGILLDAFCEEKEGGTGKRISKEFFPAIAKEKEEQKKRNPSQILLIAGGVTAENYLAILSKTSSDGVDLSSSLESEKGNKSQKKVERFMCGE